MTIDPGGLPPSVVIERPFPDDGGQSTYSARCRRRAAGNHGARRDFECWLYQHGLRHMGEIELARGLVGLGGMTS
jgi:hypothetical protein